MSAMQKLKAGAGYAWAGLCLLIILATFIGLSSWEQILAKSTGIHVSPVFSGGEVQKTIDHGSYRTLLRRPVFDGLIGERTNGFVQIDWVPDEKQPLPALIEESLDIDSDGAIEMEVRIEPASGRVQLGPKAPWVLNPEPLISAGPERILRVALRNPHR
jgi:hypothetical protein